MSARDNSNVAIEVREMSFDIQEEIHVVRLNGRALAGLATADCVSLSRT